MVRGGSWNNKNQNAACAYRNYNDPDNTHNNLGFRLCQDFAGFRKEVARRPLFTEGGRVQWRCPGRVSGADPVS